MNDPNPDPTITLEQHLDAIEAGELLDFIQIWLASAPPAITADLHRYAWPNHPADIARHLSELSAKLTGQHPPP